MKSPAFQFYADDFLAGTFDMSTQEVGAYVRLLCHQWNRGSIPVEPEKQQRLAGGSVSADVLAKFELCDDGQLRNTRLERERQKQSDFRAKQAEKGRKSGESRRSTSGTTVEPRLNHGLTVVEPTHEPETNSPVSSLLSPISNKQTIGVGFPTLEEVKAFGSMRGVKPEDAEAFWHHFESSGWIDKNGHAVIKWQSKLMTWKVQAAATNGFSRNGAKPLNGTTEAIIRQQELQEVQRKIFAIKDRDPHMDFNPAERARLKELRVREKELKRQLGYKMEALEA